MFTLHSTYRPLGNTHTPQNTIEHTHAKTLVSALEHQVSWGDTYDDEVNHQCNLAYASK